MSQSKPNLLYAERDAAALREHLVRFGNFDRQRVILLTGEGRRAVLAAAERLAAIHARDRERFLPMTTLFAFFFTGHGQEGRLLTADHPLGGEDLATIFKKMNATLTVGFFDACFAGVNLGVGARLAPPLAAADDDRWHPAASPIIGFELGSGSGL